MYSLINQQMTNYFNQTENNMTTTISSTAPAGADFTQLTPVALALAAQHDMEIVGCSKGFNVLMDGDIISGDCSASEIEQWLKGYDAGKDDAEEANSIPANRAALVNELVKADQIIVTLMAKMSDEQKQRAGRALLAAGFSVDSLIRHKERHDLILESRGEAESAECAA